MSFCCNLYAVLRQAAPPSMAYLARLIKQLIAAAEQQRQELSEPLLQLHTALLLQGGSRNSTNTAQVRIGCCMASGCTLDSARSVRVEGVPLPACSCHQTRSDQCCSGSVPCSGCMLHQQQPNSLISRTHSCTIIDCL